MNPIDKHLNKIGRTRFTKRFLYTMSAFMVFLWVSFTFLSNVYLEQWQPWWWGFQFVRLVCGMSAGALIILGMTYDWRPPEKKGNA
ncbi:hypothetical protein SEA_GIBBLES_76 [Gordonia phage Gibbles]|uniref:Uncharacterized protein n=3 Tax=Gordonia phage Orchid TaxID=1838075 RepID=A0A160DH76_9CAUD|nr:hypothetical protein BH761_gp079 [Gordonia phage Orchid]ANA87314.1 hypothetical protein PBI_PATRICKSTAR_80 [Gordonia phage PatrickStar]ANA87425.1 hypothetical protein PBI_ORCHID_79 [Gordonia phage Orchid]ANA87540.1 hypothetical protein PBI_KAMPE_80 [Gordonia phage Kampe]QDK02035.1 hypothetical protein SEA_GIBBLES_76 [Gordonia phage Gibbles]